MKREILDLVSGDIPFLKRIFLRLKLVLTKNKEYRELDALWKLLDMAGKPPVIPSQTVSVKKMLYPAFALGFLGLLIGLYTGFRTHNFTESLTIAQEVIYYGE